MQHWMNFQWAWAFLLIVSHRSALPMKAWEIPLVDFSHSLCYHSRNSLFYQVDIDLNNFLNLFFGLIFSKGLPNRCTAGSKGVHLRRFFFLFRLLKKLNNELRLVWRGSEVSISHERFPGWTMARNWTFDEENFLASSESSVWNGSMGENRL